MVGLGVLVQTLALAGRCDVPSPSGMLGIPKVLLAFEGFWFVLVSIDRWDLHPLCKILFLFVFAFLGSLLAFAFLSSLLFRFLLFLSERLDSHFQSKDLSSSGDGAFHVLA